LDPPSEKRDQNPENNITHKIGAADYNIFYLEFLIESTFQLTHSCTMRNLNEVLLSAKLFCPFFIFFGYAFVWDAQIGFFYFATNKGKSEMLAIARRWSFWYMLFFCYHMLDMRTNNQILKQK